MPCPTVRRGSGADADSVRVRRRRVCLAVALVLLPGCTSYIDHVFDDPVLTGAAWVGAFACGAPALVACLPISLPLSLDSNQPEEILLIPGIPTAILGAFVFSIPARRRPPPARPGPCRRPGY